jgi:catalase
MSDTDRDHLAANIVGHASDEVSQPIQERVVAYWAAVDPELGARVASGLGISNGRERVPEHAAAVLAEHANRA